MNRALLRRVRRQMLTSLMIITLSLSLGACGSDDGGANTPDAGDLRDVGTDAEDPGDAEDPEDTEAPDDTGDCDVCTPGTSRCTDEGAQSCVSLQGCAQWADPVACQDDEVCTGGRCAAGCEEICELDASECSGEGVRTCVENVDGCPEWSAVEACEDDLICSGGQCQSSCEDACTEGELRCDGEGAFQACEQQSTGCLDWSATESCSENLTCDEGICIGCTDGEERCSADATAVETCQSGEWVASQSCPLSCSAGQCDDQVACQPGARRCNGQVAELCNATGTAYLHVATCAVSCDAGLCTGACEPGQRRCNGQNVETCNTAGTAWEIAETCDGSCDITSSTCALDELDITADTNLDGLIVVDGPFIVRPGVTVTSPNGDLTIRASSIHVELGGSIVLAPTGQNLAGKGNDGYYCGYPSYVYTDGTGGGYGTRGQAATCRSGGSIHGGEANSDVSVGSPGGKGYGNNGTPGGLGGGRLSLEASTILIEGSLRADGQNVLDGATYQGGAGSGGGIRLAADDLIVSGTISTAGGTTDSGGGSGGEGRIKLFYGDSIEVTGTITGVLTQDILPPLQLFSSTHPVSDRVYNDDFETIALSWERPFPGLQGYYHRLDRAAYTLVEPSNGQFTDQDVITYTRDDVSAGRNYLHVTSVDSGFEVGESPTHFTVRLTDGPPTLSSDTHANQAQFYNNDDAFIRWSDRHDDSNFTGYRYVVDRYGDTVPTHDDLALPVTQKQILLADLEPGIWAFHLVSVDTMGYLNRSSSTYLLRIGDDPGKGSISGIVTDSGGQPVAGATISLNRGLINDTVPAVLTTASGTFNLQNVPAGEWEVGVYIEGATAGTFHLTHTHDIVVHADQTTNVTVNMP
ncbi:carboxypeptidase regulatory-like domain-containing protein [Lujinxingia vulgaris]|uniref:Carboxypeptidase regulatory-like domain-containing protein n=1 Tax=Lujinxingia vulgaris TaxID=2600176 RepID=A0A5C6XLU0_9DELT|nr:carboxypeptidase-like regulatory domain-containing protein [Lujinxingia vulgaris]TXD43341.1 carboxypeptidase regulatory-like domain-containing protein [Lujinxingia vulgaris]